MGYGHVWGVIGEADGWGLEDGTGCATPQGENQGAEVTGVHTEPIQHTYYE